MIIFAARTKRMVPLFLQEVTGVIFDGASGHSSPKLGTNFVLSSILRWQLDQISRVARNFQIILNRRTKIDQITKGSFGRWRDIPDSRPSQWNKVRLGNIDLWKKGSFQVKLSSKKLKRHGTRRFLANLYVFSRETYLSRMIFKDQWICQLPDMKFRQLIYTSTATPTVLRCRWKKNMGKIFSTDVFLFLPQIWAFGWEDGLGGMYIFFRVLAKRSTWWNKVKGHR